MCLKTLQFDVKIWVDLPGNRLFLKTLESSILSVYVNNSKGIYPPLLLKTIWNIQNVAENSTIWNKNLGRPTRK